MRVYNPAIWCFNKRTLNCATWCGCNTKAWRPSPDNPLQPLCAPDTKAWRRLLENPLRLPLSLECLSYQNIVFWLWHLFFLIIQPSFWCFLIVDVFANIDLIIYTIEISTNQPCRVLPRIMWNKTCKLPYKLRKGYRSFRGFYVVSHGFFPYRTSR